MPKVSIIIPTYNRANFVEKAIRSVLGQTFQDFEIIVIDDGSTDNTKEAVFSINDPRIRYFYQSHTGLETTARNRGMKEARGEYISLLDSDDLLAPHALEVLKDSLDRNERVDFVYGKIEQTGPKPSKMVDRFLRTIKQRSGKVFNSLILKNFIPCLAVMFRRECLEKAGYFDEDSKIARGEDWGFFLRISYYYEVEFIDKTLGYYVIHGDNVNRDPIKVYLDQINVLNRLSSKLEIPPALKKRALAERYFRIGSYKLLARDSSYKEDFKKAFSLNKFDPKSILGLWLSFLPISLAQRICNFTYNLITNFM